MQEGDLLNFKGVVSSRGDASPLLVKKCDAVLVHRGQPRWLVIKCPDGCGEEIAVNLDRRTGAAWSLYQKKGLLSLYPSVWRQSGCRSHFIIWRNRVIGCGIVREDADLELSDPQLKAILEKQITDFLVRRGGPVHFAEIAEVLEQQPWDVWACCRNLRKAGRLGQGVGKDDGKFFHVPA